MANSALLAKVQQALGADDVRPLTDTVSALAVSEVDYQIAGTVTLFADAEPISTMAAVNAAAEEHRAQPGRAHPARHRAKRDSGGALGARRLPGRADPAVLYATHCRAMGQLHRDHFGAGDRHGAFVMGAPAKQFCPLCRGELCMPDAVRTHLVADHKRSAAEADELIARFDTAQADSRARTGATYVLRGRTNPAAAGAWTIVARGRRSCW